MTDLGKKLLRYLSSLRIWFLLVATVFAVPARADFWGDLGKAAGQVVKGAGDGVGAVAQGAAHLGGEAVKAAGNVVGGAVGAVAPEAGNQIKDAAKRLGNGVETGGDAAAKGVEHVSNEVGKQIEENPLGVLIAVLYPPAALFVLGAPTIIGQVTCGIVSETYARWVRSPECDVGGTLSSLSKSPVATLGEVDEDIAFGTTMFKCLGIEGWSRTGCEARGIGRPVRDAQHSNDGFWTVDLALEDFQIKGIHAAAGRFLRLELRPNRWAHSVAMNHFLRPADRICFGGPVLIDKGNWLEVHPIDDFQLCPPSAIPSAASDGSQLPTEPTKPALPMTAATQDIHHIVVKGDNLSTIAQHYYGSQTWQILYTANRAKIKHGPDLIYPGQNFFIPHESTVSRQLH